MNAVGWYTVGRSPTFLDLSLHTQLLVYNESPIFLTLSPNNLSHSKAGNLPIEIYQSVVDIIAGRSMSKFVKIAGEEGGYRIETGEAERIAVESASRQAVALATGNRAGQESSESTRGLGSFQLPTFPAQLMRNSGCWPYNAAQCYRDAPHSDWNHISVPSERSIGRCVC